MLMVEKALVERYHWSLPDLDQSDIESLFPFFFYVADYARDGNTPSTPTQHVYADQASWI